MYWNATVLLTALFLSVSVQEILDLLALSGLDCVYHSASDRTNPSAPTTRNFSCHVQNLSFKKGRRATNLS